VTILNQKQEVEALKKELIEKLETTANGDERLKISEDKIDDVATRVGEVIGGGRGWHVSGIDWWKVKNKDALATYFKKYTNIMTGIVNTSYQNVFCIDWKTFKDEMGAGRFKTNRVIHKLEGEDIIRKMYIKNAWMINPHIAYRVNDAPNLFTMQANWDNLIWSELE